MAEVDYFSRQRSVPDWHQPLIETQTALVLGIGGIGCTVAKNLCRLGVGEVIVIDRDTVAASNINRQVLYNTSDVGRSKVSAALDGLRPHCIKTKLTGVDCDAVEEWSKIVELARRSNVVFNGIDVGEYFDYAVASLCVSLSVDYIAASSYGHSAVIECFPSPLLPRNGPCWACNNSPSDRVILSQLAPPHITKLPSLSFIPKDSHMPATQDVGSSVLVASLAATLATGSWVNSLHGYQLPHWTMCDFTTLSMTSYRVESSPSCLICTQSPRYSSSVLDVYFGVDKVSLSRVPGTLHSVATDTSRCETQMAAGCEAVRQRLDNSFPHSDSQSTASVFLPVIPAIDPPTCEGVLPKADLPTILHEPLLKTKDGSITAIASGQRSAIILLDEGCYRLKGCGCYLDKDFNQFPFPSFPVEKIEGTEGKSEIRGCCFKHTAHNEQYMCNIIASLLQKVGVATGNRSLCVWHYSIPNEPVPMVPKYCGVFETFGERRLSSDLLPGLTALLPHLFPTLTLPTSLNLFPPHRITTAADGTPSIIPTWSMSSSGREKKQEVINLCQFSLPETPLTFIPKGLSPRLLGLWLRTMNTLRNSLPLNQELSSTYGSVVAALYWQLGWEVGVVTQTLATNGINWGYFIDHNPFEPHCNQHPNNFVILPPGNERLLSPVDFDLAFTADRFVSPYTGTNDESLFQSWMESGLNEMERALGGEQVNTGVQGRTEMARSPAHTLLKWGLCDTLVCGYREALTTPTKASPLPPTLRHAMDCLVTLALIHSLL